MKPLSLILSIISFFWRSMFMASLRYLNQPLILVQLRLGTGLIIPQISSYGNYISYQISDVPAGSSTFTIKKTDGTWQKEFIGVRDCYFSADESQVVFQQGKQLHFLSLGNDGRERVVDVRSYQRPYFGSGDWITYQPLNNSSELVLVNLVTRKEQKFDNIGSYTLDYTGKILLLNEANGKDKPMSLKYVELETGKSDANLVRYIRRANR